MGPEARAVCDPRRRSGLPVRSVLVPPVGGAWRTRRAPRLEAGGYFRPVATGVPCVTLLSGLSELSGLPDL